MRLFAFFVNDLRIGQNQLGAGIFFECDVNDGQPLRDPNLRSREANSLGLVHGLKHVLNQFLEFVSELRDRLSKFFKYRISKLYDRIDHAVGGRSFSFSLLSRFQSSKISNALKPHFLGDETLKP